MESPASAAESDLARLSLADRWRLLRWVRDVHPAIIRQGIAGLPALRRADVVVLSWSLAAPREQATEGVAGEP